MARSRSIAGLLWSSTGVATQAVGQFAVTAVLARLLTPADFGVVTASLLVVGFARLITTEGVVGPAVTQRAVLTSRHVRAAVALALVTGVMMTAGVWLLAPSLADFFREPSLVQVTHSLSLVLLLQSLSSVPQALLLRDLDFRKVAISDIVSFLGGFAVVGVGLAFAGAGVWALVGAYVGQAVIQLIMLVLWRPLAPPWRFSWQEARDLLVFGGGHTLARYLNYIALQGDFLVVGRYLSTSALGIYGRAYQLATTPAVLLGGIVDKVLFPTLASRQDDRTRLADDFHRAVTLTVCLTGPVAVLLVVLAPEAVALVLGPSWVAVVPPLQVLAATLPLRTGYKLSDALAKATGEVYSRAWRQAVYAGAVVGGALLTHSHGLTAVAAAVAAAITCNYFLMAALSLRVTGTKWSRFCGAHIPGAIMATACTVATVTAAAATRAAALPDVVVLSVSATFALVASVCVAAALARSRRWNGGDLAWLWHQLAGRRAPSVPVPHA